MHSVADAHRANLRRHVGELSPADRELWWERWGMRTEDGQTDDITAGWAALDEVRAQRQRQNPELR
jgi:hypothetical protein